MEEKKVINSPEFNPIKDKAWYAITSFTGYEFKVESDLRAIMLNMFPEFFDEVLIITHEEEVVRVLPSGKESKRMKTVNLFPGYIYLRVVMTDEVWFAIRNTKYVSGIVGSHGGGVKPTTISDEDMNRLLKLNGRDDLVVRENIELIVGETVMIISGPFAGHIGVIDVFERTKNIVKLTVEKFENASIIVETDNIKKVGDLKNANIG